MHFTPIQTRMLRVLADGLPHRRKELWQCLQDELAPMSLINQHIMLMRAKLRMIQQDIVCELNGRTILYRHVQHLNGASPINQSPPSGGLFQMDRP